MSEIFGELFGGLVTAVRRNTGYKLLAVAVAVLLYAVANDQQNPPTARPVYVTPQIVNLPNDMVVKSGPPGGPLMVSGQAEAVTAFNAQDVKATIDVSRAKVGVNPLPIVYKYPPGSLDIESAPSTAMVVLEKKQAASFVVEAILDNDAPSGYMYGDPVANPRKVTVYGSASEVARVGRIIAQVENTDNSRAVESDVLLSAQDLHKQGVDTVQIEPSRVHVSVALKKAQGAKAVLLSALMTGSPAPGYVVVGYTFSPPLVTITGTQTLLAARSSLTVPLVIDGIEASETRTVKVVPPAGLMLQNVEDSAVRVRLDVRRIAPRPTPLPSGAEAASPRPTPTGSPQEHPAATHGGASVPAGKPAVPLASTPEPTQPKEKE